MKVQPEAMRAAMFVCGTVIILAAMAFDAFRPGTDMLGKVVKAAPAVGGFLMGLVLPQYGAKKDDGQ